VHPADRGGDGGRCPRRRVRGPVAAGPVVDGTARQVQLVGTDAAAPAARPAVRLAGATRVAPGQPPADGRAMRRQLILDLGIAAAFAGAMVAEMALRSDNRTETTPLAIAV